MQWLSPSSRIVDKRETLWTEVVEEQLLLRGEGVHQSLRLSLHLFPL